MVAADNGSIIVGWSDPQETRLRLGAPSWGAAARRLSDDGKIIYAGRVRIRMP